MKILLLNQVFYPDPVATAQHTRDLALYLVSHGHEVTVVAGNRGYEKRDQIFPSRESYQGVDVHRLASTGLGKRSILTRLFDAVTFDVNLALKLLGLPRHDLVVSFTSPPLIGLFGTCFCMLKGGESVQWLMDVNPDAAIAVGYLKENGPVATVLNRIFEFTLKRSGKIVVLDRWMRRRIVAHGAADSQMVVIPPWPVQAFSEENSANGDSFRAEHGLTGKFVVMYSGNHSIVHPLDTLLEAAVRLKDRDDVVFLFIGAGLRVHDVEEARAKHGLKNVMHLPSQPRERLHESLAAANLHVVVMGNQMSGLVHVSKIYGALASGQPYVFVGPRQSHVIDLIEESGPGFHVDHGDVPGFVDVVDRVKGLSSAELQRFAANRGYVARRYSMEKSLGIFLDEVVGSKAVGLSEARMEMGR